MILELKISLKFIHSFILVFSDTKLYLNIPSPFNNEIFSIALVAALILI